MPETAAPAFDFSADADLISFLKAIPDGRYRRGVRYPQWYLLLVTVLGDFQERCHSSAATQAALIKGSSRIGLVSSIGLLIHTSSG